MHLQAFEEGGGGKKAEAHRALAEAKAADARPAHAESNPEATSKPEQQQQKQRDGPDPRFPQGGFPTWCCKATNPVTHLTGSQTRLFFGNTRVAIPAGKRALCCNHLPC